MPRASSIRSYLKSHQRSHTDCCTWNQPILFLFIDLASYCITNCLLKMSIRNCCLLHHLNWPWNAQSSAQHGPPAVLWLSGQYLSKCKGGYHLFQNMSTTDLFCDRCISCIGHHFCPLFFILSSRIKSRLITGPLII